MAARTPENSARWVGLGAAVVGQALALAFFLFVDLGGTMQGVIHPLSFVAAAAWAGPLWIYAFSVRTPEGALVGGAALLAATTGFLVSMSRSTSSTSAIGVITIPMLLYPLAVILATIDRLVGDWRSGEERLLGAFGRRILAAALSFVVVFAVVLTITGVASLLDPLIRDEVPTTVLTIVSAGIAIAGGIGIKRLWRSPSTSPIEGSAKS